MLFASPALALSLFLHLVLALTSVLRLSLFMWSYNFISFSLEVPLKSRTLYWGVLGRRLWNCSNVDVLKHSSFNEGDLSPSLMSNPSVLSVCRYQAVASVGLFLLISSERCWERLSVLKWNCRCSDDILDVFFFMFSTAILKAASSSTPVFGEFEYSGVWQVLHVSCVFRFLFWLGDSVQ